jgi:transposase
VTASENSNHAIKKYLTADADKFSTHSTETVKTVLTLVLEGEKYSEISRETGISTGTISLWARGYSRDVGELSRLVKEKRSKIVAERLDEEKINFIAQGILDGKDVSEISDKLLVSPATVYMLLNEKQNRNTSTPKLYKAKKYWSEKEGKKASKGSKNHFSKLTEADVKKSKVLLSRGTPQTDIASQFSVQPGAINKINTGRTWKHVTADD